MTIENTNIQAAKVHYNLHSALLVNEGIRRGEGTLTDTGAFAVTTGKYTGRSPKDKFIVDTEGVHEMIHWGNVNRPISRDVFNAIREEMLDYLKDKDAYVFDGYAGTDVDYRKKFRVINEYAWQNLFIRALLVRPTEEELEDYGEPDFTILAVPGYKCDAEKFGINSEAAIIIDYEAHYAIIAGSAYGGEIKKTVFSIMNYVLPIEANVLPMHCSSNMDPETGETAVFFGLSGTGKTTLSADHSRILIGDDEHGWAPEGIFNIEGGCYAKCIDLKEDEQPDIFHAIKFGSVIENAVLDESTHEPDFEERTITENIRVAYPLEYIDNAARIDHAAVPKTVIFLTADAYGVLPPISRLSEEAAMYHFITGFTAKVAGTERGIKEPQPTFSTLFGEPFMPLRPEVYAEMLGERIRKNGTKVYLVNTGWSGGPYGVGSRIKLKLTRAMIRAALSGELEKSEFVHNDLFNVDVPVTCPDVPSEMLDPKATWTDGEAYDTQAHKLAAMFHENFKNKYPDISERIAQAGPQPL